VYDRARQWRSHFTDFHHGLLAAERGAERTLQGGVAKRVATGLEPRGQDALARQQELVRHLAQREVSRERGQGHQGGAAEHAPQGAGELGVGRRRRRDSVHRPTQRVPLEDVADKVLQLGKRRFARVRVTR